MEKIIGNYVLAFIDVLGQQTALKKIKQLPTDENEKSQFIESLRQTYGVIENLKNDFIKNYSAYNKAHDFYSSLRVTLQPEVKFCRFSDSLIIYHSIMSLENKLPILGIYSLLASCGHLLLISVARQYTIRGGIDLGIGMEISEKDFYGPVLACAHNLEKISLHPRILIGRSLYDFIELNSKLPDSSNLLNSTKKIAQICLEIISKDNFDGNYIIDYLGEGFNKYIWKDYKRDEMLSRNYILFLK